LHSVLVQEREYLRRVVFGEDLFDFGEHQFSSRFHEHIYVSRISFTVTHRDISRLALAFCSSGPSSAVSIPISIRAAPNIAVGPSASCWSHTPKTAANTGSNVKMSAA